MMINLFVIMMTVFALFAIGVMVTVIVFALKRLLEWLDVACWNAMIRHETKKQKKKGNNN